jgi:hypothetical protein
MRVAREWRRSSVDITPEQRKITGAVVERVQQTDWDGDITPYIDDIVSSIDGLIAEDAGFAEFAEVIRDQAVKWSLAAWSEELVPGLSDSGWSKLADRLKPYVRD